MADVYADLHFKWKPSHCPFSQFLDSSFRATLDEFKLRMGDYEIAFLKDVPNFDLIRISSVLCHKVPT